jgi:hypothetical protein
MPLIEGNAIAEEEPGAPISFGGGTPLSLVERSFF